MKKLLLTLILVLCASSVFAQTTKQPYVVAPYWQADQDSYTFVAITHPSLSGTASTVGITVTAYASPGMITGGTDANGAQAVEFTVSVGSMKRIFIVPTNQANVNPTNFPNDLFIITTSGNAYGHLRMYPKASHPDINSSTTGDGDGMRNINALSMWGGIVVPSSNSFMSMEFIGDMQSSKQ